MATHPVTRIDGLLAMLDDLLRDRGGTWWDKFYSNRAKSCPFFVPWPDHSLVSYFERGLVRRGRVLELGCGNGRNAVFLARQGCEVDAVDFSAAAISWAEEQARDAGVSINFICGSVFETRVPQSGYDLVYDCGCFHHVPPHRRPDYLSLVDAAVKPDGRLGLVCFRPEGGSGLSDRDVYEQRSLGGGLGYTEEQLRHIFGLSFETVELRRMAKADPSTQLFGEDFLWAGLMRPKTGEPSTPP